MPGVENGRMQVITQDLSSPGTHYSDLHSLIAGSVPGTAVFSHRPQGSARWDYSRVTQGRPSPARRGNLPQSPPTGSGRPRLQPCSGCGVSTLKAGKPERWNHGGSSCPQQWPSWLMVLSHVFAAAAPQSSSPWGCGLSNRCREPATPTCLGWASGLL